MDSTKIFNDFIEKTIKIAENNQSILDKCIQSIDFEEKGFSELSETLKILSNNFCNYVEKESDTLLKKYPHDHALKQLIKSYRIESQNAQKMVSKNVYDYIKKLRRKYLPINDLSAKDLIKAKEEAVDIEDYERAAEIKLRLEDQSL